MTSTLRNKIVATASWALSNKHHFTYTEGPTRWKFPKSPSELPTACDCSAFVTGIYRKAGAPDPNGSAYAGGYTGTLLEHGEVTASPAPGDLVIYFDGPGRIPSTGSHVAVVVEVNADGVLTISHGRQGDPEFCWVGHVKDSQGHSSDLREHEFRSYLPTQTELLKQKPTSEPAKPTDAPKSSPLADTPKEGVESLPSPELVTKIAEGEKDTSGVMEPVLQNEEAPDVMGGDR